MTQRNKFAEAVDALLPVGGDFERLMQGTPIYPDVWRALAEAADQTTDKKIRRAQRHNLLLTPHREKSAIDLFCELAVRLYDYRGRPKDDKWLDPYRLTTCETHVAAQLTLDELVCVALPLTKWWHRHAAVHSDDPTLPPRPLGTHLQTLSSGGLDKLAARLTVPPANKHAAAPNAARPVLTLDGAWFFRILGLILWRMGVQRYRSVPNEIPTARRAAELVLTAQLESSAPLLWSIGLNRPIQTSIWRSTPAIKADAARRLFDIDGTRITWAVIDSGIDATHIAFRRRDPDDPQQKPFPDPFAKPTNAPLKNQTRVIETCDFTRLRSALALRADELRKNISQVGGAFDQRASELRKKLAGGRFIDWEALQDDIRVRYDPKNLAAAIPQQAHGTHVAGILAADWPAAQQRALVGVCPGLHLYDLRVVDNDGIGDEFSILAAIDFIRYRNASSEQPVIHGVNISMSILHDVRSYACGRTPVCEACDRLIGSGVVVVAAAGNLGYAQFRDEQGHASLGYRTCSITDPGNCESVITVGATHRYMPHQYGVSFFSSRGPTGDGRFKPDLVAPGEKISAPVPGDREKTLDGTSMAAPHVSGAAALLMARHSELIGDPRRIKKILCDTATDLGRERYFQGAGMLDILRALQSV